MILEYIRYSIDDGRQAAFMQAYKAAAAPLQRSRFCKGFEISRCVEARSEFIVRIVWTSVADHLEGFRKSPEFREFFGFIRPYVGDIAEMRHYEVF